MSPRQLLFLVSVIAIALAAMACNSPAPDAAPPGASSAPVSSAAPAPTVTPAEQAAFDEQARADLAADVRKRIEEAQAAFGADVPVRVESGLFVLIGAERGVAFEPAAAAAEQALDVYLGSFFARRPDRAVSVYLVHSAAAFARLCGVLLEGHWERDLGAYSRKRRNILVNIGPGLPTIDHELVHPLVQTDFPRIPVWFDEGLGALFEKPVFAPPGEVHGAKNWRYDSIATALASPKGREKLHLTALFALNDDTVDGVDQDLHYAVARFFCQWLDEHGQLWPFYRAWRDGIAGDFTGQASFAKITGMTLADADASWLAWLKGLR